MSKSEWIVICIAGALGLPVLLVGYGALLEHFAR